MKKLCLLVLSCFLFSTNLHALRPASLPRLEKQCVADSITLRMETRSKEISVLEIGFFGDVEIKIVKSIRKFFKDRGFHILKNTYTYKFDNLPVIDSNLYDFILLNLTEEQNLINNHVISLLGRMRSDGCLFIKATTLQQALSLANEFKDLGYDIMLTNLTLCVKQKFHSGDLFYPIADEIRKIMEVAKNA